MEYLEGIIGLTARMTVDVGGTTVTPYARAAYAYDFIGDEREVTASFAGTTPFNLRSEDPSQSRFELGLDAKISDKMSLGLGYEGGVCLRL